MSTNVEKKTQLPAFLQGNFPEKWKQDELVAFLNQEPPKEWIKKHPFINNHLYIPIERIEWLLKSIFKRFRIEIISQNQTFNGVVVMVRVHFIDPLTGEWDFHDGIGAVELQLRAQTKEEKDANIKVLFSVENINKGAISMAYPIAKTLALKDACDHFGKLFGSDVNRKNQIEYGIDPTARPMDETHPNWSKVCDAVKKGSHTIDQIGAKYYLSPEVIETLNKMKP